MYSIMKDNRCKTLAKIVRLLNKIGYGERHKELVKTYPEDVFYWLYAHSHFRVLK